MGQETALVKPFGKVACCRAAHWMVVPQSLHFQSAKVDSPKPWSVVAATHRNGHQGIAFFFFPWGTRVELRVSRTCLAGVLTTQATPLAQGVAL